MKELVVDSLPECYLGMATVPIPCPQARSHTSQIFVVDYEFAEANGELGAFRGVVPCLRLFRKIPLTYNVDKFLL